MSVGNYDSNVGYAWKLMELFWCKLAECKKLSGYEMNLCFPSVSKLSPELERSSYKINVIDFKKKGFYEIYKQLKFLKENRIRIIYFTDYPTVSMRYILYKMVGVRTIIVHDHTPGVRSKPGRVKKTVKILMSKTMASCSAAFAVSPYVAQRLKEVNCMPAHKVYCITNGIEPGEKKAPVSSDKKPRCIVTVGRVTQYKGIDFAIKTIACLVHERKIINFCYLIYGDGPDLAVFQAIALDLGLEGYIKFMGISSQISKDLLDCHIAFHPSKGEAMSLAILEYMRASIPVVMSDNPSVSSAFQNETGVCIYKEGSIEEAANCLSSLLTTEDRRSNMGKEARAYLEQHFSQHKMLQSYAQALNSVINN